MNENPEINNRFMRSEAISPRETYALISALTEAVALYGKPGGPWNVPSDPGGWMWRAKKALSSIGVDMNGPNLDEDWDWGQGNGDEDNEQ